MPVQRYTRKIIRYTAVIVTVWNLNGSVLALFFYRIKILMTQIHNKNLFQQVCCNLSSPNTERDPNSMKRWYDNWDAVSPIFKFSAAVRKVTYTTNSIESLNAAYRKLNRQRSVFPSDTALLKALYLSTFEATKKWTTTIRNWAQVYGELSIMYEGRLPE